MLDTKGPEIRTGIIKDNKITLKKGDKVRITTDFSHEGNAEKFAINYSGLLSSVKIGTRIQVGDGNLQLSVTEIDEKNSEVECLILNKYVLGTKKNVNIPGVKLDIPTLTEKDINDVVNFGCKNQVDMIALSFTRTAQDVLQCRKLLNENGGKHIQIIPKIENEEGISNLDEILKVSDGIMIARGDLGMELDAGNLFLAQKYITQKCLQYRKPSIMAT